MTGSAYAASSAQIGRVTAMTNADTREKTSAPSTASCSVIRANDARVTRRMAEPITVVGHEATLKASR